MSLGSDDIYGKEGGRGPGSESSERGRKNIGRGKTSKGGGVGGGGRRVQVVGANSKMWLLRPAQASLNCVTGNSTSRRS